MNKKQLRRIIKEETKQVIFNESQKLVVEEDGEYKVALNPITKKGRENHGSSFKIVKKGFESEDEAFDWIEKQTEKRDDVGSSDFEVGTWKK